MRNEEKVFCFGGCSPFSRMDNPTKLNTKSRINLRDVCWLLLVILNYEYTPCCRLFPLTGRRSELLFYHPKPYQLNLGHNLLRIQPLIKQRLILTSALAWLFYPQPLAVTRKNTFRDTSNLLTSVTHTLAVAINAIRFVPLFDRVIVA